MIGKKTKLYGWGINDSDYPTKYKIDGKYVICPYYARWISIVQRGYDPKEKQRKPTYIDVTVCNEWQYFSVFREWLDQQPYWKELTIDKDILEPNNKIYCPKYCVLVPSYLNKTIVIPSKRTELSFGVSKTKSGNFVALGLKQSLGTFKTELEAHAAWQANKASRMLVALGQYRDEPWYREDVDIAISKRIDTLYWQIENKQRTIVI